MYQLIVRRWAGALLASVLALGFVAASPASAADGPIVSIGDQSGLERDSVTGSVFMPVFLSEPAAEPVVVSFWTVDATAAAGADYIQWGTQASPRTVTIPAGALQTTINVPVLADTQTEDEETFSVVIGSVTGGDATLGDNTGTATIVDADGISVANPAITVSNPTVIEGTTGQRRAQFLIHLSRQPASPVTVTYTTADGTALVGSDYVAKLPGTVVFAPGQISKTIDVLVNANTVVDGLRSFTLDVAVTGGSPVEELTMSGTATVADDDTAPAEPCAPGTFSSADGNEPCTPAPPGYFVDTTGAVAASPCQPGSFQSQAGQISCTLAPLGSYVAGAGAIEATQCPDGTTTGSLGADSLDDCAPVPTGAIAVAAGNSHSCAVIVGGTVACWGFNGYGQLGNGTYATSRVPVVVTGINSAVAVSAGGYHTCALLENGAVRCWGSNDGGQLGNGVAVDPDGSNMSPSNVPVAVMGITDATAIAAGGSNSCALLANGAARCWGKNDAGQLGNGTYTVGSSLPVAVSGLSDAAKISVGGTHSCVLRVGGTATCWGANGLGQLGDGTINSSSVPVAVSGLTDATTIAVGSSHSCAVLGGGTARCWGYNAFGQLGGGILSYSSVPVAVSGFADATTITVGPFHSCAALGDGTARCWGRNDERQLGNGSTTNSTAPVVVTGVTDATAVTAGRHSCELSADGTISCWGPNEAGQLGNGTTTNSSVPVTVVGIP